MLLRKFSFYIFFALLLVLSLQQLYIIKGPLENNKTIVFEKGMGLSAIATRLKKENIIASDFLFKIYAFVNGLEKSLHSGEYEFKAGINYRKILNIFRDGKSIMHSLTIPEGLSSYVIIHDYISKIDLLAGQISDLPSEGSLLPETYLYNYGQSKADLINRMRNSRNSLLQKLWTERDLSVPFKTPEEAVILASIIEKETGINAERERISGVFMNRLRKNIPLQSDPTAVYAITKGERDLGRKVLYKDLAVKSKYNTYLYKGLPPSPICNPGEKSLYAALHPEKHQYLYFVASEEGGHSFSKTLEEHQRHVRKYRLWQKKNMQN